jgi:predicted membrane metal-binding protein
MRVTGVTDMLLHYQKQLLSLLLLFLNLNMLCYYVLLCYVYVLLCCYVTVVYQCAVGLVAVLFMPFFLSNGVTADHSDRAV